jgi:FkbM family methyltransferase
VQASPLSKLTIYVGHLYQQLQAAWRTREFYRTYGDACRALGLRLVAIRSLRRLASPGCSRLRLRGVDRPFHLRRATSDFWVFEEIYANGEYAVVTKLGLPEDATIIDLGANIGLASRYFSTLFPRCRIVAVEPDHGNCQMIADNCPDVIDNSRLKVVRACVAAKSGVAALDRSLDSWGFTMVAPEGRPPEELIPCITVEQVIEQFGCDHVDLLKCDIEGSEGDLFKNCSPWIGQVRNMIIETHTPYSLQELYTDLHAASWSFDVLSEESKKGRSITLLQRND